VTWREVAKLLADRMQYHAYCPDNHTPPKPATCPFCADKVAYDAYRKKVEG
jgi:hypothetical protein